jgi:hypothetical protein
MIQIAALRSRLEKQPTDLRRNPRDLEDGALAHHGFEEVQSGTLSCAHCGCEIEPFQ